MSLAEFTLRSPTADFTGHFESFRSFPGQLGLTQITSGRLPLSLSLIMGNPHSSQTLPAAVTLPFCGRGNETLHECLKKLVHPKKRFPVLRERNMMSLPVPHTGQSPIIR